MHVTQNLYYSVNKRHFQPAQIAILTPEEWLAIETVARIEADLQQNAP